MNPATGEIKSSIELEKLGNELSKQFTVPIDLDDMTDEQRARFEAGEQPVVKLKDNRSTIAKQRLRAMKDDRAFLTQEKINEQNAIQNRRAKNKRAKQARKHNRK